MFYAAQAQMEIDAGLLESAEETVGRGLALDPNHPLLWLERARYQQARGMQQLAIASARYALAIWAQADPEYQYRAKAEALLESLESTTP
jgi:Tfp pilus assembly protein PilF